MRLPRLLKFLAVSRGTLESLAGDLTAAERAFRAALDIELAIGQERDDLAQTAARLAFVLWRQGRDAEAAGLAVLSADAAPSESPAAQALSQVASARATADPERASEAADLVPEDMPNLRADVLVELAAVLRASGDEQAARRAVEEAIANYDRKGNLAAIAPISP